jgi:xanthine dehydrogenase accessory factor
MYHSFFSKAQEFLDQGRPFATAAVVLAEKPTSGKPGDKALITADGTMYGWIGGSCSQPTVIREAQKAMKDGKSRLIRLSPDPEKLTPRDGLIDFPMTCFSGGTLEIYIEPQLPQPRLLVVGNLPIARALIALGRVMNYDVITVDPDASSERTAGSMVNETQRLMTSLDDIPGAIHPDTYAVVATHGNFDEMALAQILKGKPRYVGLVASKKRFHAVLDYLRQEGIAEADLERIKAPAGLDIQAQQGEEIALSILAEIVQRRHQEAADWTNWDISTEDVPEAVAPQAEESALAHDGAPMEPHHTTETDVSVAIDPVCGMKVEIATAKWTYEYQGKTYYFCAPGCKASFRKDPQAYMRPLDLPAIDPVCGMTVDNAHYTSDYQGKTYYFCGEGCKATFDQNPEAYLAVRHET